MTMITRMTWPLITCAVALSGCQVTKASIKFSTVPVERMAAARADLDSLVAGELSRGRTSGAFSVLEARKTRDYAVRRLGGAPTAPVTSRDLRPILVPLLARLAPGAARGLVLTGAVTKALPRARQQRDDLFWRDLRLFDARVRAGVPYADAARKSFAPVPPEEAALMFGDGEAFLSFFVHGEKVHVFVVADGKLRVETLAVSTTALGDAARRLIDATANAGPWREAAEQAHAMLIAPFERDLVHVRTLTISPDAFLANLPWAVLAPRGGPLLIERLRVTLVPSATILRALMQRPIVEAPPRLLAVGNAHYPRGVAPLPFAEVEADSVADVFDEATLLTGDAAGEGRVTTAMASHNIFHFATHGLLLGNTAPDASSLLVSEDGGGDGFLSVAEIAALDLRRAQLAVLSACETSVGAEGQQAIDLGNLSGAFLAAGAPTVIGSLWKVDDTSTTTLMLELYRRFLEVGAGEALRQAQLTLLHDGRHAHPYHWAAFVVYGWDK